MRVERWEFAKSNESLPLVRVRMEEGETTEWEGQTPMVEALVDEITSLRHNLAECEAKLLASRHP